MWSKKEYDGMNARQLCQHFRGSDYSPTEHIAIMPIFEQPLEKPNVYTDSAMTSPDIAEWAYMGSGL